MKQNPILIFFFSLITVNCSLITASAQQITNCSFEQQSKKVVVYYDISSAKAGQTFNVSLYLSADAGKTWQGPLIGGLSGDVGSKISSGPGKQITWDVLASREKLEGDNIMFEIRALPEGGVNYTETVNGVNIDMVFIKGGTFQMGSPTSEADRSSHETQHSVTLSDYYIGKTEVTIEQYMAFVNATNTHYPEWLESGSSYNINGSGSNKDYYSSRGMSLSNKNYPITGVSWNDAQAYCEWLSQKTGKKYGLPSEAQWEYASRGGASASSAAAKTYSGSNDVGSVAWYSDNSGSKTHAVGQKNPNELGIYDMSGNVWEWCSDWYGSYSSGSQTNPTGPSSGSTRVRRGGSWPDGARGCRSAYRGYSFPDSRSYLIGFRLVCVP